MKSDILQPIEYWAQAAPAALALRDRSAQGMTHGALRVEVHAALACLEQLGLRSGHRVVTLLGNSAATAVAHLSLTAHCVAVPLNPGLINREYVSEVSASGGDVILTDVSHVGAAQDIAQALGLPLLLLNALPDICGRFRITKLADGRLREAQADDDLALILKTSGSTGSPKRVPLTGANLAASARNLVASLELNASDICLNMMPMFHIGAIVDLLLGPLAAGGAVAFADDTSIEALERALIDYNATWFQAVPTVLRGMLTRGLNVEATAAFNRLRFVRVVSQSLPPELQDAIERSYAPPLVPIYGMTEMAGLIASCSIDRTRRKRGGVGQAIGCEIFIVDEAGNDLPPLVRGEVHVAGSTVMRGYEGTDAESGLINGRLKTGDEGYLDEQGHLFLTGRIKELINRGGEKISPKEIDDELAGIPGILEGAAFEVAHATLGDEVGVAIVRSPGAVLDKAAVMSALRLRISDFKLPRRIIFVDALPRLPSGKLDRRSLMALSATSIVADGGEPMSEVSPLGNILRHAWQNVLGKRIEAADTDFFDAGGDSLSATTLLLTLENITGRTLSAAALFDVPTLGGMEAALWDRKRGDDGAPHDLDEALFSALQGLTAGWRGRRTSHSPLVFGLNTEGRSQPFFWVCQGVGEYEGMWRELKRDRPLYVMPSVPNIPSKTPEAVRGLILHYTNRILAIAGPQKILIGGFCEGALMAFQIAQTLRTLGRDVQLLCLQDRFVPEPYSGAIAMFTHKRGNNSSYNLSFRPERAWKRFYNGRLIAILMNGDHHECHEEPYASQFAQQLEATFDAIQDERCEQNSVVSEPVKIDSRAAHAAISFQAPLIARQGSKLHLRIRVVNLSPVTWPATDQSGLIVAAR